MCGRVDVDQMLEEMTPEQFSEWQARDYIEPIGMRGVQEILAMIGAMISSAFGSEAVPDDFMYWRKEQTKTKADSGHDQSMIMLETIMGAKRG